MAVWEVIWPYSLGAGVAAGLGLGWVMWGAHDAPVVVTAPVQEVRQNDGSVVLGRTTQAPSKPPHKLPKGRETNRVHAVIEPRFIDKGLSNADRIDTVCPPVVVDVSTVDTKDGTRVVISSPDGDVTGEHIVFPTVPVKIMPWAIGAVVSEKLEYGVFVDRDFGPLRVGAEVMQTNNGLGLYARAGLRF
jgi:hypothetical protein